MNNFIGYSKVFRGFGKLFCTLCLLSIVTIVQAQQPRFAVSGVVKDNLGEALIGATITVRGKNLGAVTNLKGEFELKALAKGDMLQISYVGMQGKAITVQGAQFLTIVLDDNTHLLDEVVAIGYGSMKKSDLTGSMSNVSGSSFAEQRMTTAEEALRGRVAGVMVNADNSPGGGISIQIRGSNSMLGGTEPLYVVDGFPLDPNVDATGGSNTSSAQSSMNYINPDDIESMEVLKDASATAIYGARGANGVVLITTKSGKLGKTSVSYSGRFGLSHVSKKIELLNEEEYANYSNQFSLDRMYVFQSAFDYGLPLHKMNQTVGRQTGRFMTEGSYPWEVAGKGTDWQDAIFQMGMDTRHTVQVQGSSGNTRMSLSLGYSNQQGIVKKTSFERYTINATIDHPINKLLTIRNRFNLSRGQAQSTNTSVTAVDGDRGIITAALWMDPTRKLNYVVDDSVVTEEFAITDAATSQTMTNPYELLMKLSDDKTANNLQNQLSLEYKPIKDLTATGNFATSYSTNTRGQYAPITTSRGRTEKGVANIGSNEMLRYMLEARLNYQKKITKGQSINAMLATTYEYSQFESSTQKYSGFPDDKLKYHALRSAVNVSNPVTYKGVSKLVSYIGRLNYNYNDRYLLTGTLRLDGSSRAAMSQKYGFFPSLAAAWRVTQEPFMPKSKVLNNLKLRLSYGSTGTYPNEAYRSLFTTDWANTVMNNQVVVGIYEPSTNPNVTWERTDQYNAGADISLFKSRINLTLDFYYKRTNDLLQNVQTPTSTGYSAVLMNLGEIENKGFEFTIDGVLHQTKIAQFSASFNGSINRNKIMSLGGNPYVVGVTIEGNPVNRFIVGEPMGLFYGYEVTGVFKDWNHILNHPDGVAQRNATPGDYIANNVFVDYLTNADGSYKLDADGNKIENPTQVIDDKDRKIIGDPNPDFIFGLNLSYKFKNFDVSVLCTGQLGGDVFWGDYSRLTNMNSRVTNKLKSAVDNSWQAPYQVSYTDKNGQYVTFGNAAGNTQNAQFPRTYLQDSDGSYPGMYNSIKSAAYHGFMPNSNLILDGTHIRIQNVSVGYNFRKMKFMQELRLSVSATNLFTLTSYPGYDPTTVSSSSPMRRGIDFGGYPTQSTYSLNVQAKF